MRSFTFLGTGILALTTASAVQAATIISTGTYAAQSGPFEIGSVDLGPGKYRFQLDVTSPLTSLNGGVTKQVSYNEFCDLQDGAGTFSCGGNESPETSGFVNSAPGRYIAKVTVALPTSSPETSFPYVRIDNYDVCCTYTFAGQSAEAGQYTFSYSSVPEPQAWTLLIVGFGVVGLGLRRRAGVGVLRHLPA